MVILHIKKVHPEARIPSYAHDGDAGMDMYAVEDVTIEPGSIAQIRTGIALSIPDGYVGLCWDKSGLSFTYGLTVLGGVIDAGYRGEIVVGLINLGKNSYTFHRGDKVVQLVLQPVLTKASVHIQESETLDDSVRGERGFGSSGK